MKIHAKPIVVPTLLLMFVPACGGDEGETPPTAAGGGARAELTVEVGTGEVPVAKRGTLASDGEQVTGTGFLAGEAADAAAGALDADGVSRLVNGPITDVACTEIYGGPDVAHVTGTIDAAAVDATFHRANGCGIADWDALVGLLGAPLWTDPGTTDATYGDPAHPITLPVGQQFTVRLESNPSTGYEWQMDLAAAMPVELVREEYKAPDTDTDTDVVGAPGQQRFVFQAVAEGAVTIEFSYVRPWEEGVSPADTRTVHVAISAT
jgi:predicted secreted protein